jgi:tRNA(Ile)-lysidine synthase
VLTLLNASLFRPGDRVGVAVSGGIDSVALLRALFEKREQLGLVLAVVHFNHRLRGEESEADQRFVTEFAEQFDLPIHRSEAETRSFASEKAISIEAAARELRYAYFGKLIRDGVLDKIATAHTLDDQAETVLLRLIRGTGTSGLAGILPQLKVGQGMIVRPLLNVRRADVVAYIHEIKQPWREDSTNGEEIYTRNRIRQQLMPLLRSNFNPEICDGLANLAKIALSEDEFWTSATAEAFVRCYRNNVLEVREFERLHGALQRRVLRLAAAQKGATLDFAHTERVLGLLEAASSREQKTVELPNGFRAVLRDQTLALTTDEPQPKNCGYSYLLPVPGEVAVPELRLRICAFLITGSEALDGYNDDHKLALDRLQGPLTVRNWRAGDRFWPAHTRTERKLKELLQDQRVPAREKSLWPVALVANEIVWVRGLAVSAKHLAKQDEKALIIKEFPL